MIDSLNALTPWFRNILEEKLIVGWRRDTRERLTLVMEPLANEPVAVARGRVFLADALRCHAEFRVRTRNRSGTGAAIAPVVPKKSGRIPGDQTHLHAVREPKVGFWEVRVG